MIKKQWNEIKNNYSNERYELIKKYTIQVDSVNDTLIELDTEYSDTIQDEDFYSIVEYLDQVTDEDIKTFLGYYGIHSLYIDKNGRGLLVLQR